MRLIVITDRELARPHPVEEVVAAVLRMGVRAIQLRDKAAGARALLEQARRLRALTSPYGALLFVNDRFDVALAAGADGVHLGPEDLPVLDVRRAAPAGFLIGYSTDDPEVARRAAADGADYIGCGTVYATASKGDAGEAIGLARLDEVAQSVGVPVVGIGGIDAARAREVARTRATGVAVIRGIMAAPDPGAVAAKILAAFTGSRTS
ncbi:MAG: thiamine phosphate synthase [Gemmatimonadetes bacterium]|nr:thiamine phosphate synthase [Gemmatimonadota bacterium]